MRAFRTPLNPVMVIGPLKVPPLLGIAALAVVVTAVISELSVAMELLMDRQIHRHRVARIALRGGVIGRVDH